MVENREEKNASDITFEIVYGGSDASSRLAYAREKLGAAVYKLATGRGKIKERLSDAFIELAILQEGDMPAELWEELKAIRHELTRGKMQYETAIRDGRLVKAPVGLLPSTLRFMRLKRAEDIAKRICELEARLDAWAEDNE